MLSLVYFSSLFVYDTIFSPLFCVTRSSTHLVTTPCPFLPFPPLLLAALVAFVLGSIQSLGYIHNPACTTSVDFFPPSCVGGCVVYQIFLYFKNENSCYRYLDATF